MHIGVQVVKKGGRRKRNSERSFDNFSENDVTLKAYLVCFIISIFYCYWLSYFSSVFVSLFFFRILKWSPKSYISNRHHRHSNIGLAFGCLAFPFHGLHFEPTLRVLKLVLCFHMTSFNYVTKGVRDVNPTSRYHRAILCLTVSSVLTSYSV